MRPVGAEAGEREGFALISAIISILIFSYVAFAVLAADRGALAGADAAMRTARLEAAADAGLATAVHGLGAQSAAARWSADGRPRRLDLDGTEVTVTVEDERGKASMNTLTETQWRRLFQAGGASGARLDRLVDGVMDWRDGGDRIEGGLLHYARRGVRPRWAPMRTIGELAELDGMDPALLARITPSLTLFWGASGAFEDRNADPLAMRAMSSSDSSGVDTIVRQRELAGQRTALEAGSISYVGRPVTVRLVARDAQGGVFRRTAIVEFTGRWDVPYWLRALD